MEKEILIDRYLLEEIAGEGSYSIVFRGYDQQDKKKVAVKELKSAGMPHDEADEASRLFFNEINILKNLNHPNIAKVYDFFIYNGRQYMVMEWVEGVNLEVLLKREGKITQRKALDIMKQAADALCYLQGVLKRIVYRDFKPSNLLLDKSGHLKIIDFGIARYYSPDKTKDTHILGTPGYAPPEAYEGKQTDFSSDIYSLGVTIYHITTGEDPLQFRFRFPDPRKYSPDLTYDFSTLLRDCLKSQEERISDGVELQRRLRKITKKIVLTRRNNPSEKEGAENELPRKEVPGTDSTEKQKKEKVLKIGLRRNNTTAFIITTVAFILGFITIYTSPDFTNNTIGNLVFFFLFLAAFLGVLFFSAFQQENNAFPFLHLMFPLSPENSIEFESNTGMEIFAGSIILVSILYFILIFTFIILQAVINIKIPLYIMVIIMVLLSFIVHRGLNESIKTDNH